MYSASTHFCEWAERLMRQVNSNFPRLTTSFVARYRLDIRLMDVEEANILFSLQVCYHADDNRIRIYEAATSDVRLWNLDHLALGLPQMKHAKDLATAMIPLFHAERNVRVLAEQANE